MTLTALLPFIVSGAVFLAVLSTGLALLPSAATYPVPAQAIDTMVEIYRWMYTLNMILPVDTLAQVIYYFVVIIFFTRLVYPAVFWIIMTLTGGGQ